MFYNIFTKEVMSSDCVNTLYGKVYVPAGEIKGLFQVVHGMAEHMERYDEFLGFMAGNGYVAFMHDHMGHGKTGLAAGELGYIADEGGYKTLIEDVRVFAEAVKADFPDKKHILMGHSMGSFVVRNYAAKYGEDLSGLIPMGTGGPNPAAKAGMEIASLIKKKYGAHHISPFVQNLAFGSYNARTEKCGEYDWLSVNKENIAKYKADELCGFPFTVSAMQDLITLTYLCNSGEVINATPKELPVLLVAGTEDPVGAYGKGVKKVAVMLFDAGVKDVKAKLYKGFRHEILNEACKERVTGDILEFADKIMAKRAMPVATRSPICENSSKCIKQNGEV